MKTMRWSSLRWLAVIVAVVLVEGNWARAAPSPRNDDMFRELLKLDQIYSSIARPRYTRSGPINIQMGPKAQRAIMRLRELDQEYGYKARPRYVRSGADNKNIKSFINNLYALDQEYGYKSRPRFGKRTETNSNFAPIDYDGQVSLQLLHPQFGFLGHWCGGVMISNEWLLTAAHCINNDLFNLPLAALWTAVLGDWDRDVEEKSEQRIPIEEIIIHERFHNFQHDIALMKLSRSVKLAGDSRVRAVCLPTKRLTHNQTDLCIATGWGRSVEDGMLAGKLLEAKVPVHDNAICRKKYGHSVNIRSGHLCAGHLDGSSGTCVGDSGGPLQCALHDGRWILAGITSFGSGCAKPGFPDVYTRLSYYLPWIRAKTRLKRS